jgi:hypothetical protein
MPEKPKLIVIVSGQHYDGTSGCERLELEDTAENRKFAQETKANPTRTNLRRLFDLAGSGPTADLIKDGWTFKDD